MNEVFKFLDSQPGLIALGLATAATVGALHILRTRRGNKEFLVGALSIASVTLAMSTGAVTLREMQRTATLTKESLADMVGRGRGLDEICAQRSPGTDVVLLCRELRLQRQAAQSSQGG